MQKIQRGLRRLSIASDRSGEILQAVSGRLDDLRQAFLETAPSARQPALMLDEVELLGLLDRLEHAGEAPDLPDAARSAIEIVRQELLTAARWQPIARIGAKAEGADIRVAEFLGLVGANGQTKAAIHRVLEQGYRRADGTLLRPGVVIAAASGG
ncbi:MAG: hypothetical protein M0038_04495 [Pseudomonadota bacterium]|nr:hypothetical protein [Pseudomonadota bacterium]